MNQLYVYIIHCQSNNYFFKKRIHYSIKKNKINMKESREAECVYLVLQAGGVK